MPGGRLRVESLGVEMSMESILVLTLGAILLGAFVESALLPVPLTLFLAPIVYEFREAAPYIIVAAIVGSTFGSVAGTFLGRWRGRTLLRRLISEEQFDWTSDAFAAHGTFGLFLAAVSPLPYIPFTISAGIYGVTYQTVFVVAAVGRGIKYTVEVLALVWLTNLDPTLAFLTIGGGLVAGYLIWSVTLEETVTKRLATRNP